MHHWFEVGICDSRDGQKDQTSWHVQSNHVRPVFSVCEQSLIGVIDITHQPQVKTVLPALATPVFVSGETESLAAFDSIEARLRRNRATVRNILQRWPEKEKNYSCSLPSSIPLCFCICSCLICLNLACCSGVSTALIWSCKDS